MEIRKPQAPSSSITVHSESQADQSSYINLSGAKTAIKEDMKTPDERSLRKQSMFSL